MILILKMYESIITNYIAGENDFFLCILGRCIYIGDFILTYIIFKKNDKKYALISRITFFISTYT